MDTIEVVVVGAGPVGLLMAIELALGGVRVAVMERLAAPSMALKAGGIGPLGIEALQRRGMASAIDAAEQSAMAGLQHAMAQAKPDLGGREPRYSGHFGGLVLIRADAQREPDRRGSRVDQQAIEAILTDRVRALGIEIHREHEVKSLVQHETGVEIEWTSPTGDGRTRCSYVVGCDGGRSTVRKLTGFAFPGWEPTMTMYQAVAEVDHPERLPGGFRYTAGGMFFLFAGRIAIIDFRGPPPDRLAPVTHDEFEDALRRTSGAEVRIKTFENASRWTDNTRLVDTYRHKRVLLAGDAAHIHSPFGGQGLSLGLVDAQNLGWKLAAVVRDERPDRFLDTYTDERRPIAEAVLANTLAQVAIMRPDAQSGAMRALAAKLMDLDDANRFFGDMMSGLYNRYDLGSDLEEVGRLVADRPVGANDTRLYDLMTDGAGLLLDASPDGAASRLASARSTRIRCVAVDEGPSMLIRPDACLAWMTHDGRVDGLEEALQRWFAPKVDAAHAGGQTPVCDLPNFRAAASVP